ncbi:MAG: response regulator [Betaproteobacteria bacterium]|nr:response regulator [Betaproteobacteria bacterium]
MNGPESIDTFGATRATVLLTDDAPEYLMLLGEILSPHYNVRIAGSGASAIELAAAAPQPSLILLDVEMPGMDGYETIRRLREQNATRDIPVIFVTANNDSNDERRGLELGAVDYITKPPRPAILLARVRNQLELKRARDALQSQNAALAVEIEQRARAESEARRLNEILDARKQALERAVKNLESFSYSVSHDLRAPLRTIAGYAEMLGEAQASQLSDEGRHMLDRIIAGARKMDRLIQDILDYSKAERLIRRDVPIDMAKLVPEVAQDLASQYPGATFEAVGELPKISADLTMVRQILANLIGNAFKFSSKRSSPRIEVGANIINGVPEFFVRDNGAGFNQKYATKLFHLFQRMHSEQEFPGTGVGLALVKRLIEFHGGRISAESEPDVKTVFRFTLAPETVPAA